MRYREIICEATAEPSLRAAIRTDGKIYSGELGDSHLDVLRNIPDPKIARNAIGDGDNRGFTTERGRFLDRRRAQAYAVQHHLFRTGAPDWVYTSRELISEWLQTWLDKQTGVARAA